jgi:multisite-specific tRNA:(cytosine-C5)-methyltransferase
MFPSGKGSKDVEVNTDVDADMKDSTDMGEGEQERNIAVADSNNGDSPKTEEKTEVDCESGEAPTRYKKLNSTSTRTEHSDYPLHRCMRIVPHDQNSGAFFIAVLHKHSSLNGNVLPHSLILQISLFIASVLIYVTATASLC